MNVQDVDSKQDVAFDYQPRTELGEKLMALRRAYLAAGEGLLSPAALDEDVFLRRGGFCTAAFVEKAPRDSE